MHGAWPDARVLPGSWFPADAVEAPEAKFLDVILYSREQILAERGALPCANEAGDLPDAPWGIISIKAQDEDHETPMQVAIAGASASGAQVTTLPVRTSMSWRRPTQA